MPKNNKPDLIYIDRRYCTQDRAQAPIEGGDYIHAANGMTKRWMCACCIEARRLRHAKNASHHG